MTFEQLRGEMKRREEDLQGMLDREKTVRRRAGGRVVEFDSGGDPAVPSMSNSVSCSKNNDGVPPWTIV